LRLFDFDALRSDLDALGLADWADRFEPLIRERLSEKGHGDFGRWRDALDAIAVAENDDERRTALLDLRPWRKGPLRFGNVTVDAEWRSDLKWARLEDQVSPLGGRSVLDVGCGNGWYAIRMREAGARCVIGVDPTVLFNVQFAAARHLTGTEHVHVLPLRLEELPVGARAFDTTFSMGVLYHRRDPDAHLRELMGTLKPGGELVLETLVAPGDGDDVIVPQDRYARMRNVWHLPTVSRLCGWLGSAGFGSIRVVDVTVTTVREQRPTEWMTFESLAHALDPEDPALTIEGLPAPTRALVVANAP
jgi:tRNA (mo5U34)-methyltransferase